MITKLFFSTGLAVMAIFLMGQVALAQPALPDAAVPSATPTASPDSTALPDSLEVQEFQLETADSENVVDGPTFIAEETPNLTGTYTGPVFVAGGSVTFSGEVQQDLIVAGGTVRITGQVGQDVYAAGGTVMIDGQVGGNVIAAGGEVQMGPASSIGGSMIAGSERLILDGALSGPLYAGASRLLLNGSIGGDAWVGGETLELGDQASISGDLRAEVRQPFELNPSASIAGTTEVDENLQPIKSEPKKFENRIWGFLFRVGWRFILLVVVLYSLPGLLKNSTKLLDDQTGRVFMNGLLAMIGLPFVMMLIAMTFIGLPLAGLTFLVYLFILLTAWLVPSMWAGQKILPGQNTYLQALIGVAVVVAVSMLPVLGALIQLIIAVFGFGVIVSWLRSRSLVSATE
jgi:cytoskeletal protein CcmA (bactofilin family)